MPGRVVVALPSRVFLKYKEDILPRARGDAARMLEAAEGFRQEQIAMATGRANRFLAILKEFKKSEEVTRQRLYLEAMEKILPDVNMIIGSPERVILVTPQTETLPIPLSPIEIQP